MSLATKTTKKAKKSTSKVVNLKTKKAFRTYKQGLEYLFSRTDYEKHRKLRYNVTTFSLDRMQKLLSLVGNPHKKLETAHIAGTKGKGSTATMLARMLEANGYSVGLYTSPHVVNLHERIAVDGKCITDSELLGLINHIHEPVEKLAKNDEATFFEIMTAMAFMHFVNKKVDMAVIETGLGGRLDSTNVINPSVVGMTSISIDHQNLLGETIDSIAMEKAGIFKKGIPIVTVQQEPEAMRALKRHATKVDAPISITGSDIDF